MQETLHCNILWPTSEYQVRLSLLGFGYLPIAPHATTVQPLPNFGKAMIDSMDA
jgi:hypothetical protein